MSIHRLALLGLVACSGSAARRTPPVETVAPGPKTCDDAAANLDAVFAADEAVEVGLLRQRCADERWNLETIECAATVTTPEAAGECFAAMVSQTPICSTLAAIIDAGRDGEFTSIRGAADPDIPTQYASTITLSGAGKCDVFTGFSSGRTEVMCSVMTTEVEADFTAAYNSTVETIDLCLRSAGWSYQEGSQPLVWLAPRSELPEVIVQGDNYLRWTVRVVIRAR